MRARTLRHLTWRLFLAAAVAAAGLAPARAQEASGYAELTAERTDYHVEDATGQRTDSRTTTFLQRYGLDMIWRLYPNFQMQLGGQFERNHADSDLQGSSSSADQRRIRPYINFFLRNPVYFATLGYYRSEDTLNAAGPATTAVQEIYNTTLGWQPEPLSSVTLRYIRTNNFDADHESQDVTDDLVDMNAEYRPVDELQLYFRGGVEDTKDRLSDFSIRQIYRSGRATYGDSWWNQRIQVGAEYDVTYHKTEVTNAGTGEFASFLFPLGGLSKTTDPPDTPADGILDSNPALIDQDKTASAGINLGLPPSPTDTRPRNIGLDLGSASTFNTLYVWVDKGDLPPEISGAFSWDLYTSTDSQQKIWDLEQSGLSAISTTEFAEVGATNTFVRVTRFEIRITELNARYVKVVTRPLDSTIPTASGYPDLFVTECGAALRTAASDAQTAARQTTQYFSSNVRARLLENRALYYEGSYFIRDFGTGPSTYTLSNGFSFSQKLNPVYSVAARVAREDGQEPQGDRLTYLYSALVKAVPYSTYQSSLVFSGRSTDLAGETSRASSVFLYNNAELYKGVNVNLGLGDSILTRENGERDDTTQINAQASFVPQRTVSLNLLYQRTGGRRHGGDLPEEQPIRTSARQASLTYRPLATLYFFLSYRFEQSNLADDKYIREYSVSWTPFPDGSLQVLLNFNDAYRSDFETTSRIYSPRLRWNVSNRSYVELAYQSAAYDSLLQTQTSETMTASARIWF